MQARQIINGVFVAIWSAAWAAFWVVAFLLYAIVGGFGGSKRARRWPKTLGYDPGFDPSIDRAIIRECNYFDNGYCVEQIEPTCTWHDGAIEKPQKKNRPFWRVKRCVALRGQPCKWLDEVVRPLAPYGYIERKDKP